MKFATDPCETERWHRQFACSSGQCIPSKWYCDGEVDCDDKSDEIPDLCGAYFPRGSSPCMILTETSGEFYSPGYDKNDPMKHYPIDTEKCWFILGEEGSQIQVNFINFQLDNYDG